MVLGSTFVSCIYLPMVVSQWFCCFPWLLSNESRNNSIMGSSWYPLVLTGTSHMDHPPSSCHLCLPSGPARFEPLIFDQVLHLRRRTRNGSSRLGNKRSKKWIMSVKKVFNFWRRPIDIAISEEIFKVKGDTLSWSMQVKGDVAWCIFLAPNINQKKSSNMCASAVNLHSWLHPFITSQQDKNMAVCQLETSSQSNMANVRNICRTTKPAQKT